MKKLIKTIFVLFLALAFFTAIAAPFALPGLFKSQMAALGFPEARLDGIRFHAGPPGLALEGLALDATGRNGILRTELSLIPLRLTISGAKLDIDLTQEDGPKIANAPFPASDTDQDKTTGERLPLFPPLVVNDASITLLTTQGSFRFNINGQMLPDEQGRLDLKGRIAAAQAELGFTANIQGSLTPAGDLTADIIVSGGVFALPDAQGRGIEGAIGLYLPKGADGEAKATARAATLTLADIPLENVTLDYHGLGRDQTLRLHGATRDKSATVSLDATALMQQNHDMKVDGVFSLDARKLEKIKSSLAGSAKIDLSFSGVQNETGVWTRGSGNFAATVNELTVGSTLKKANGRLDSVLTATKDGKLNARTTTPIEFSMEGFRADIPASAQDPITLDLAPGNADGLTLFSGKIGKLATFNGQHNLKSGKGSAAVVVPPIVFTPQQQPENLIAAIKGMASDVKGSLGADIRLGWTRSGLTSGSGHVLLKDISATAHDITVQGVNAVLTLDALSPPAFKNQTISIARLDAGLPLTEGVIDFGLNGAQLSVNGMTWAMAGGFVTADPFSLDLDKNEASLTLKAQDLDLAELFRLAPMEGLTATGKISGHIPVAIKGDSVLIDNGVLETSLPGVIRYDPKDVPSFLQNPSASSVIDLKTALKNFQYETLKMTLNGEAGHEQQIALSVKGKNPEFYNGSPVNINLNLGGVIDKILKYNLSTYKIPEAVQKQMEAYEKEHGGL